MTTKTCPGGQRLQVLLEQGDLSGDADELVHHLERCPECQETLQELVAPPDDWLCTARGLRDEVRTESALHRLVQQMKEEELLPTESDSVSCLRPSDKPGVLGLLDRYEVQEEIGRGGMGVVFKARDPDLNRIVAIKVLSPWLVSNATARQRFIREAKAAAAVCHDHIVTVHAVESVDGLPYLVMQYVAGESLQIRLNRAGPLAVEEVVRIGLQTAMGLAAAHALGLIHRDIKPANLLLEQETDRVKITDFGLARMADEVGLTREGVIAGTPEYMAPEQACGEVVDHRADLFSLGSVMYACCTGVAPFRGSTALAVLRKVGDEEPVPIRSLNPDVPVWLEAFIARLMAKDPAQRFENAASVAAMLEGYLAHLRQPVTVAAPELPALRVGSRQRSDRSLWRSLVLAALVLVLAVGVAAVVLVAGARHFVAATEGYEQAFRGGPEIPPDWERYGAGAEEEVQLEPNGLRITLPPGASKTTGTGVRSKFGIKGDFEITVAFEILQESAPSVPKGQTRFTLAILLDRRGFNVATVARGIRQKTEINAPPKPRSEFHTWVTLWNESTNTNKERFKTFPTEAKIGRLRLARSGSTLSCYAADGRDGDFILLQKYPFGNEDLKDIRLAAATDDDRHGSLDVRVSDFHIRATTLLSAPAPTNNPQGNSGSKKWLAALGIMVLLVLSSLGVCLLVRRRRLGNSPSPAPVLDGEAPAKTAAPSITLHCSGCEKLLKVKPELAGKKIKCPQCGQTATVPATNT